MSSSGNVFSISGGRSSVNSSSSDGFSSSGAGSNSSSDISFFYNDVRPAQGPRAIQVENYRIRSTIYANM